MKHNKLLWFVLVLVFVLAACSPAQPTSAPATPVSTALPETTIRMMQKGFFLMSHSIQPEDHVNVRPFFYPVQGWGERLVQYNLCHKASVSVVLVL